MASYEANMKAVQEHLEPGEEIRASCYGAYETKSLGAKTVKNGILLATNKRVMLFGKRFSGYNIETFPYEKISAIEVSKSFMGKSISIKMTGNETELKWIQRGDPDQVVSLARESMSAGHDPGEPIGTPEPKVADQLRELAGLRDAGIISEDDFNSKKAELLARI